MPPGAGAGRSAKTVPEEPGTAPTARPGPAQPGCGRGAGRAGGITWPAWFSPSPGGLAGGRGVS